MFDRPQRQHALGLLILIGWQAQALVRSTWPVFVAFYFQGDRDARFFIWAIAAGCALTFLGAVLHFARFTFHLEADQLHVRKGVLVRDKVNIPLDRVQAVHVEQNLLQRLFKVCGLKIDTAGSAGSELVIHALPWDDAHALRSRLLQSAQVTTSGVEDEPRPEDTTSLPQPRRRPGHRHVVEGGALPKSPVENWVRHRGLVDVSGGGLGSRGRTVAKGAVPLPDGVAVPLSVALGALPGGHRRRVGVDFGGHLGGEALETSGLGGSRRGPDASVPFT